jgi:hypothetical protein
MSSSLNLLILGVLLVASAVAGYLFMYPSSQISGFENMNSSNRYTGPQSMSGANTTDTADQAKLAANGMKGAPTGANAGATMDSNRPVDFVL